MRVRAIPRTMLRAFLRDYGSRIGFAGVLLLIVVAIVAPTIEHSRSTPLMPPSLSHPLGTTETGMDVAHSIFDGAKGALIVGFVAAILNAAIGLFFGSLAGFFGGRVDRLITRIIEVILSVPSILMVLALRGVFGMTWLWDLAILLGVLRWTDVARVVRGEVLRARSSDWVTAAFALGSSPFGILLRHILPEALGPVVVSLPFVAVTAISIEVSLAVVDIASTATTVSWGTLLSGSIRHSEAWWLAIFPGFAFLFTTTSLNLVGEALRSAASPIERTTASKTPNISAN